MLKTALISNLIRPVAVLGALSLGAPALAADLAAPVTYDNDSYIYFGLSGESNPGLTTTADETGGQTYAGPAFIGHHTFGVIQFDVSGLQTVAAGGPQKHLTLDWLQAGAAEVAVSVAGADMASSYPFGTFGPNFTTDGQEATRLQWYFDHIKGDDPAVGGYAGGAAHPGVISVNVPVSYSLDVTAVVDAWIDGTTPNHGFGLWAVSSAAAMGVPLDFAASEYAGPGAHVGPRLSSTPIPEPSTLALGALALLAGCRFRRRR